MKALLLVSLLAIVACETVKVKNAPVDVVKCVLRSDVIFNAIADIIDVIQGGKALDIITTIMALIPGVKAEVEKCLEKETVLEIPVVLIPVVEALKDFGIAFIEGLITKYIMDGLNAAFNWCWSQTGGHWACNLIPH